MPYSDLDSLPDNVKKLPTKKQKQWMAVFNSAYNSCVDDGGKKDECETSAFKQAWSVVKKEDQRSVLDFILHGIQGLLEPFVDIQERAISIDDVYYSAWDKASQKDSMAWMNSLYFDEDGSMFAIIASGGKLYRASVTVRGNEVEMGEWTQVKIDFPPVLQSRMTINRNAEGAYRWLSVSSTTVLNRVGEIDSKALFDSFIDHAEQTGEYPIRMFYHAGERFRTGQVDFLARDENLLITGGVYDDSELAQMEVKARLAEPDYWGDSIGFLPTAEPELWEVEQGIKIPVYNQGIMREVSTLPEIDAASLYTTMPTLKEVTRMLQARQFEALVKLFGGDEDAAKAWLEKNANELNRAITEAGQVTRTQEPPVETAPVETPSENIETVDEGEPAPEETDTTPVIEYDDAMVDAIARRIAESLDFDPVLEPINAQINQITASLNTLGEELRSRIDKLEQSATERIDALENEEERRRQEWLSDLPPRTRIRVTHRPRETEQVNQGNASSAQDEEGTEDVVEGVLSKFKLRY